MTDISEVKHAGIRFVTGKKKDKDTVMAISGVGKVNAAVAVQTLVDHFRPDCLINTGVAGGMKSEIKVCEIVISTECLYHDMTLRFLENYPPYNYLFKSDERLIEIVEKVCEEEKLKTYKGRIVSGDQYIEDTAKKNAIVEAYDPYAVDMESAAVAHTAFLNSLPSVSVRCMSDNADDDTLMSAELFEAEAARIVAEIVIEVAKRI
jgi:adenosylhomocysteine nucleosidase